MRAVVRKARPSDRSELMKFIRGIWGGHDYIPQVWDDWLGDRKGSMFVVEVGGVPVGMNRFRILEDGSAWFEGVRVHPKYRGQGLASLLGENSMRLARAKGVKTFRLTSGSRNHTAHRQIARMKFKEASRISVYEAPKRRLEGDPTVRRAEGGDEKKLVRLIRGTKEFKMGSGVFWDGFAAASLTPGVIGGLVREGAVWHSGKGVAVTRVGGEGGEQWRQVCFAGGPLADSSRVVRHALSLEGKVRPRRRLVYLAQGSPIIGDLRRRAFTRMGSLILFERSAAKG
ncbi:MAG: GNAT family N-acetyltransferase [archaeon]|nr:MAG: GNAT family N-acetyltransferase [archaeon]